MGGLNDHTWAIIYFDADHPTVETVVRGFEVDGNDHAIFALVNICIMAGRDCTGATKRVETCHIHNVGASSAGYGIKVGANNDHDTANVEILNNVVHTAYNDLITVYEQYGGSYGSQIRDVLVRGNEVYDSRNNAPGFAAKNDVRDVVFEFNYAHDNEHRGFDTHCDNGTPGPTNITFRYNISYNNGKGGIYVAANQSNGTRVVSIYGNLLFNNNHTGSGGTGIYFENNLGPTVAYIYNNTSLENENGELWINDEDVSATIKNNIFSARPEKTPLVARAGTITSHTNNIYYRASGTLASYGGSPFNAASLTGFEPSASAAEPAFKDAAQLPLGFSGTYGQDLRPQSDGLSIVSGAALDGGVDLGGEPFWGAINLSGASGSINRDTDGAWDIGAYEHGLTAPPIVPPANLRIVHQP